MLAEPEEHLHVCVKRVDTIHRRSCKRARPLGLVCKDSTPL